MATADYFHVTAITDRNSWLLPRDSAIIDRNSWLLLRDSYHR